LKLTAGIVVIVILMLLFLWFRRQRAGAQSDPDLSGQAVADKRYHAVSIELSSTACDGARALADQRFLSSEAPRIPLPDCSAAECECRFVHYEDRRGEQNRKTDDQPSDSDATGDTADRAGERRLQVERRGDGSKDYFS